MIAGLKGDIQRVHALHPALEILDGLYLGVRLSRPSMISLCDNFSAAGDDASHRRIGRGPSKPLPGLPDRLSHTSFIGIVRILILKVSFFADYTPT
jgi:hypothetical protein